MISPCILVAVFDIYSLFALPTSCKPSFFATFDNGKPAYLSVMSSDATSASSQKPPSSPGEDLTRDGSLSQVPRPITTNIRVFEELCIRCCHSRDSTSLSASCSCGFTRSHFSKGRAGPTCRQWEWRRRLQEVRCYRCYRDSLQRVCVTRWLYHPPSLWTERSNTQKCHWRRHWGGIRLVVWRYASELSPLIHLALIASRSETYSYF